MGDEEAGVTHAPQRKWRGQIYDEIVDILFYTAFTILIVLCLPFLILGCPLLYLYFKYNPINLNLCGYQRNERDATKTMKRPLHKARLRPLPRPLPRQLTNPTTYLPQVKSPLMQKIPVDVRLLIWEKVLGREHDNDVHHLECVAGSLKHTRCYASARTYRGDHRDWPKLGFRHDCWYRFYRRNQKTQEAPYYRQRSLLPPLLTCKLIYGEAINILYSSNTFDMRRTGSILRMPAVMLPHRLQQIRRFQFSAALRNAMDAQELAAENRRTYFSSDDILKWPAACKVLATLEHLEDLQIMIALWGNTIFRDGSNDTDLFMAILEPLKTIRAKRFGVTLTQDPSDEARNSLGATPFRVVRRPWRGVGWGLGREDD